MSDHVTDRAETMLVHCIAEMLDNLYVVCVAFAPKAAVILAVAAAELRAAYPDDAGPKAS